MFGVKVFVDNPGQVLKSGMSAEVHWNDGDHRGRPLTIRFGSFHGGE